MTRGRVRYCSSAWCDAVAAGEIYPAGMRPCPICDYAQPPTYFDPAGACFDCVTGCRVVCRRRFVPDLDRVTAAAAAAKIVAANPASLTLLTNQQQRVYHLHVVRGLTFTQTARELHVRPAAVWKVFARALGRLAADGNISADVAPSGILPSVPGLKPHPRRPPASTPVTLDGP